MIQIELAREVGKNYFERKEIERKKKQEEEHRLELEKNHGSIWNKNSI